MCIVLSGGEHRVITQLLTSIEQKDEYSYSSIHLIGGNKNLRFIQSNFTIPQKKNIETN